MQFCITLYDKYFVYQKNKMAVCSVIYYEYTTLGIKQ